MKICVIGETGILSRNVVPRPSDPSEWGDTKVRVNGTCSFLAAATATGTARILHQSIVMINKSDDGTWINENSSYHAVPHIQSAVDLETLARDSNLD
jgi:hypothetical protein